MPGAVARSDRCLTSGPLDKLEREKGAKPSTLIGYAWMVAEPGTPHKRGRGQSPGLLMAALGDRPITAVTTREVATFLRGLDNSGCKPRTVNRYRQWMSAAWNYAMRDDTYALRLNPAAGTTKRRGPPPLVLDFYEPEEVERLAQAAEHSLHRTSRKTQLAMRSSRRRPRRIAKTLISTESLPSPVCGLASCSPYAGRTST